MKKKKITCVLTMVVGILMISVGLVLQNESDLKKVGISSTKIKEVNIQNLAASSNMIVMDKEEKAEEKDTSPVFAEVVMETAPASVVIPPRIEVYEGMTLEELGEKLDRSLGHDIVAGKGLFIATECINRGVDPYVATAILLHETGCGGTRGCSSLARNCNNFGGQKGSPGCNGGSYKAYNSMDEGLVGFISNLSKNYYSVGLNTVERIGPKYAEGASWVSKINWYVEKIRAS